MLLQQDVACAGWDGSHRGDSWGIILGEKQGYVFSWMVMGPRVTVGDQFDGLTQVFKEFPVFDGIGKRAAQLRPGIRSKEEQMAQKTSSDVRG